MTATAVRIHAGRERAAWDREVASWLRIVRRDLADLTVSTYTKGLEQFARFLEANDLPMDPERIDRESIERFLDSLIVPAGTVAEKIPGRRRRTPGSVGTAVMRYTVLRGFFGWWAGETDSPNPMARVSKPQRRKSRPVPTVDDRDWSRLMTYLEAQPKRDFVAVRDRLMFLLMSDTGLRRSEVVGLLWKREDGTSDLDLDRQLLWVHGKGDKVRTVAYGVEVAALLDVYRRLRDRHPAAERSDTVGTNPARVGIPLFIGAANYGGRAIPPIGLNQILRRRCREAGLPMLHPHQFRHTWAADLKDRGATDETMMALGGWSSPVMVARYGAHTRTQRALAAYSSPVDAKLHHNRRGR